MLRTTAHPTLDRRSSRQHLDRVPVLPVHGTVASWGPFARHDTDGVPSRAVVYASGVVLSLFLVACGVMVTASSPYEWGPPQTPALNLGGGTTHGRHLTQWLAPVWYSLPALFDAIYNLGEALTRLGITPEDYRAAAEINAQRVAETEEYVEEEYGFNGLAVEPAEDDPSTDGFDAWDTRRTTEGSEIRRSTAAANAREPFKGLDCNDIDICLCCFIAAETTRVVSARGDMELCSSPL